jgi:signal transduction histidine kinase
MAEASLSRAGAATLVAAAVAVEVAAPAGAAPLAALDVLVAVAFALGAVAALPVSRTVGLLAYATATAWILGTLAAGIDIPSYAADVAVLVHRAPLALLILLYPGRALHGTVIRGLAVAAVLAPFVPGTGGPAATAAVAGLVAATAVTRAARTPAALRAPEVAAAVAAVAIAAASAIAAADAAPATELLVAYDIVLVATATTLLAPLASDRWKDAAAASLVIGLGNSPAGAPVTARLADVLHDPSLELRLHLPGRPWTDEAGRPAAEPVVRNGQQRSLTRRVLDDGTEVALIHDPAAIPDRAVAESAVAVAATAIDNARRGQDVQTRIDELRRLRRSLLDAADEERRQLEVELRSGPLRNIEQLERALTDLPHQQAETLRSELAIARRELDEVARGLHPRVLIERGLAGALAEAAARSPIPTSFESTLDEAAVPRHVALTAYYVATEALANIAKHAQALRARIELSGNSRQVHVRVTDDGMGGANPAGGGLSGLRDRTQAIDGELQITSPPGRGTVVEASLPLTDA